jgi:hypothetical protein
VKSGQIFESAVEGVHFDKGLGLAEITREASEDFARRHHPSTYRQFLANNEKALYPVFLNFEDILTALESTPPYRVLLEVIRRGDISSAEEKSFLGCFVYLQWLRSHAIMNSMIEWHRTHGLQKFEHFVFLKWHLSDPKSLFDATVRLITSHWTLFVTAEDTFPLCDSPVLVTPGSLFIALSPRMLLQILPNVPAGEHQWVTDDAIAQDKVDDFRRRTIANTFREVIFSDRRVLEQWRTSPEFVKRFELMRNQATYNRLVAAYQDQELWEFNAYGGRD